MDKPIEQYSDVELLAIIRRAENANIPGSLYQRAQNEMQIRQQQKILDATKRGHGGVFFEVGGNMTNHGVIETDVNSTVDIAVAGNYSSNDRTKIIQGNPSVKKRWYEKPIGMIILTVIAAVISAGIVFNIGWN